MKHALLIGCGNTRGEDIIKGCNEAGYNVTNIGATDSLLPGIKNITIDWRSLDMPKLHKILKNIEDQVDFVFFNQNASSLSPSDFTEQKNTLDTWTLMKSWTKSHWLSCQMPYFLLKTLDTKLHKDSVVGWMLSSYIDFTKDGVDEHADYSGYKFTNYLIMKNFANKFNCFVINPDFGKKDGIKNLIKQICTNNKKLNGEVFRID